MAPVAPIRMCQWIRGSVWGQWKLKHLPRMINIKHPINIMLFEMVTSDDDFLTQTIFTYRKQYQVTIHVYAYWLNSSNDILFFNNMILFRNISLNIYMIKNLPANSTYCNFPYTVWLGIGSATIVHRRMNKFLTSNWFSKRMIICHYIRHHTFVSRNWLKVQAIVLWNVWNIETD